MSRRALTDSLAPWAENLPAGWDATRVDDVADVLFSNVDKHTNDDEESVRLCNYVDVYKNARITRDIHFMEASADAREIERFQLRRGDVLSTKDSETHDDIAITAVVDDDLEGVLCGYHLAMMRPRSRRIHGPYLAWLHASKQFRAQYEARAVGVTRFGLPQYAFRAARIALPPVEEQRRIAAFLDRSCTAIDKAIAGKHEQLARLDGVKRDAVQIAVTRGLGKHPALRVTDNTWLAEVPEEWGLVSLKRVANIHSGLTLGKEYGGPLVERPYLRVANVQDGHLDLTEVTTIEVPPAVAHRLTLRVGDVLMTEGGDLDKLGRGTLWNDEVPDCLHQNHIFAVRCFAHKLFPSFLAYLTASQYGRDYFEATGKKTTNLAATNSTKVGQFPIPLPPVAEQRAICAHLDDKLGHLRKVAKCIQGQIDVLTDYRKSLIHEYVTGQLRVPIEQAEKAVAYG